MKSLTQKGSGYILLGKCQNLISRPPIKMWKVHIIADLMHRYSLSENNAKGKFKKKKNAKGK